MCQNRVFHLPTYSRQTVVYLDAGVLEIVAHLIHLTAVRNSRLVPASIVAHPASPVPATFLIDKAAAASRSSGARRCGLVPDRPRRTAQPASAGPDRFRVSRIHPAGPVRLVAGHLLSNPARLVASGWTAPVRSQARG